MRRVDSHSSISSDAPIRNAHTYGLSDVNDIQYSYITAHASPLRLFTIKLVSSTYFSVTLIGVIIMNAILMTITTTERLNIQYGWYIQITDFIFQAIYTFEIILKVFALQRIIITNLWHMFGDIILVVLGFMEWVRYLGNVSVGDVSVVSFLQFFRLFRVICALRVSEPFQHYFFSKIAINRQFVATLSASYECLGILAVFDHVSVISRALYGDYWPLKFGSIGNAMLSCFQLLTLDDAFTFYDEIHTHDESISVFLFLYIVIATFVVCQMLIAIILSNLEEAQTQYNDLIKDKFKRKKQLMNAIKDMSIDPTSLDAMVPSSVNPAANSNPTASNSSVANSSKHTDAPSNANGVPPISLKNPSYSTTADPNINPATSRGLANNTHRPTDPLHLSAKTVSITQKRVMDEYNRTFTQSTDREKQLTLQYFMGLASIENELNLYQSQMEVLDHLVHKLREQE